jgi:hypothetical protein
LFDVKKMSADEEREAFSRGTDILRPEMASRAGRRKGASDDEAKYALNSGEVKLTNREELTF